MPGTNASEFAFITGFQAGEAALEIQEREIDLKKLSLVVRNQHAAKSDCRVKGKTQ